MKTRRWISGVIPGIIFTCMLLSNESKAQFTSAIGVRAGGTSGFTFKHKYNKLMAFEGILGAFDNGLSITGLIEREQNINVEGLYVYYGGGLHAAFYDGSHYTRYGRDVSRGDVNGIGIGVNGIIGLEYRLPNDIPIAFSMDLKPFLEVSSGGYVGFAPDPSLGIKFVLK
jgi:hypothetical protein